jgi:hypothetical protein
MTIFITPSEAVAIAKRIGLNVENGQILDSHAFDATDITAQFTEALEWAFTQKLHRTRTIRLHKIDGSIEETHSYQVRRL